jgi:uncharacterized alkaline shock family protein YloU
MDKSNLPAEVRDNLQEIGSISYANEVIAIIAGVAASEIDGVAAMGAASSIADILSRNRRPVTKGVRVEVGSEEASVDIVLSVEYGKPIQRVCRDVQESVRKAIETMTGLHVVKVDVHVLGVSFERETQALAEGASVSEITAGTAGPSFTENVRRGQPVRARKVETKENKETKDTKDKTDKADKKKPETPEFIDEPEDEVIKDYSQTAENIDVTKYSSAEVIPTPEETAQEPVLAGTESTETSEYVDVAEEEPKTANALPKPVEFDGEEDAVFASASFADIPIDVPADITDDETEYNTDEDDEELVIDDTALI